MLIVFRTPSAPTYLDAPFLSQPLLKLLAVDPPAPPLPDAPLNRARVAGIQLALLHVFWFNEAKMLLFPLICLVGGGSNVA